jgi:hypothetical protein
MTILNEAPKLKSDQSTTTFLARQGKSLFKSSSPSHIAELETFNYNYSVLAPEIARELKNTTTNIRVHFRNALQSISKVGQDLIKTKDMLPRGEWVDWVQKEFTDSGYFTIHTAQNYMNLARLVQAHGLENLKNLPLSVIYIVAREDEQSFIDYVLDQAKSGSISRTRYHEIKKQYFSSDLEEKYSNPNLDLKQEAAALPSGVEKIEESVLNLPPSTITTNGEDNISVIDTDLEAGPSSRTVTKEVYIEQEETITYNLISDLDTSNLYHLVFLSLVENSKITQNLSQIIKSVQFVIQDRGLCLLYCLPYDIASVIEYAKSVNLNYLTIVSISKDISYRPDLNLSSSWYSCCIFYKDSNPKFQDYLLDHYSSNQSFINSLQQAIIEPNHLVTNSLLIDSLSQHSLFDEDTLFLLSSYYKQYIYLG